MTGLQGVVKPSRLFTRFAEQRHRNKSRAEEVGTEHEPGQEVQVAERNHLHVGGGTIKELVDAAKASRKSTSGRRNDTHLALMLFEQVTGAKLTAVHFNGNAPAVTALLGGHSEQVAT